MLGWLLQKVNAQMGCFAIIRGHRIRSFAQFTIAASASASVALLVTEPDCAKAVSEGSATEKSQHYGFIFTHLIMHLNDIFVTLLFLVAGI